MTALLARIWPHLAVAALVIGAIAWIDHRGYERATADAEAQRAAEEKLLEQKIAALELRLNSRLDRLDVQLGDRLGAIDDTRRETTTIIERELRNDPSLADPAHGISDVLRDALNTAIAESACPGRATGQDCETLPPAR